MNAQQMQELCRELVGALEDMLSGWRYIRQDPLHLEIYGVGWGRAQQKAESAIANAKAAFNPTPNVTGCVETAATVPACVGTGEMVKALGVGPVDACPVCGCAPTIEFGRTWYDCGKGGDDYDEPCTNAERLAITRAKQLAEAEAVLIEIYECGGMISYDGSWSSDKAAEYFRNKTKEPTA